MLPYSKQQSCSHRYIYIYVFKKLQQRNTKCCTMEVSIIIHILQLLLLAYLCSRMTVGLNTLSCACLVFFLWKGMDS